MLPQACREMDGIVVGRLFSHHDMTAQTTPYTCRGSSVVCISSSSRLRDAIRAAMLFTA